MQSRRRSQQCQFPPRPASMSSRAQTSYCSLYAAATSLLNATARQIGHCLQQLDAFAVRAESFASLLIGPDNYSHTKHNTFAPLLVPLGVVVASAPPAWYSPHVLHMPQKTLHTPGAHLQQTSPQGLHVVLCMLQVGAALHVAALVAVDRRCAMNMCATRRQSAARS